jgi:ABC-type phosphate transport system permease subunit
MLPTFLGAGLVLGIAIGPRQRLLIVVSTVVTVVSALLLAILDEDNRRGGIGELAGAAIFGCILVGINLAIGVLIGVPLGIFVRSGVARIHNRHS